MYNYKNIILMLREIASCVLLLATAGTRLPAIALFATVWGVLCHKRPSNGVADVGNDLL
jgi:hypothetical protein